MSRLVALSSKLNLLSPDLVHGDEERHHVSTDIVASQTAKARVLLKGLGQLLVHTEGVSISLRRREFNFFLRDHSKPANGEGSGQFLVWTGGLTEKIHQ